MTWRTKAAWQALIVTQQKSGLRATAFCRERGTQVNYFCRVRRQLQSDEAEKQVADFVSVSVSRRGAAEKITVRHECGASVGLPISVAPIWVAQLLLADLVILDDSGLATLPTVRPVGTPSLVR